MSPEQRTKERVAVLETNDLRREHDIRALFKLYRDHRAMEIKTVKEINESLTTIKITQAATKTTFTWLLLVTNGGWAVFTLVVGSILVFYK